MDTPGLAGHPQAMISQQQLGAIEPRRARRPNTNIKKQSPCLVCYTPPLLDSGSFDQCRCKDHLELSCFKKKCNHSEDNGEGKRNCLRQLNYPHRGRA
ncbi:hypothetical protein E2C01_055178 [Portunus trituberculatus]|uniref:Uncharacterized protein n=1 Tax=Portunus trituberculatus TaxID=210409 RepID=A0A5B7GUL1_PORTR|nr:hypothetical protein [Portunus trituberculatus]